MYSEYIRRVATTVHIPDELLEQVDRRARSLKISRNRYIVHALRRTVADETAWSPAFLEALDQLQPIEGVDELERAVIAHRKSKGPPRL